MTVVRSYRPVLLGIISVFFTSVGAAAAGTPQQNDLLNAVVWMQTAIEYRANCLTVYALAKIQLDAALADKTWTAYDQSGNYQDLPPAVVLDLDETAIDNSAYEATLAVHGGDFDPKSWDAWVRAEQARAIPGAIEFTQYAESKGVKIFYVTNRTADQKVATKDNLRSLGFPTGGNVDTFLMKGDRPEWAGSMKGERISFVAKDYRVLLLFGDNIGDFSDQFDGTIAERDELLDRVKDHFGRDWMMLPNPAYGSWESAVYRNDFTLSDDEKRARKMGALSTWPPKP